MSVEDNEAAEVRSLWDLGTHMDVGARYLAALQKLGLDPECLLWAEDELIGHPVLVLVTEQLDRVGPLDLSRMLFKAYDHAGTPREINPFILRLHSPSQTIIKELSRKGGIGDVLQNGTNIKDAAGNSANIFFSIGGMKFRLDWIYKWSTPKVSNVIDLRRRWRRFTENVNRLAA